MDNEVTINFLSDEQGKNDKGQVRLFKTYASDKCWRITTRTRKEKCGWFSLVSLTRPLFCDSISFPDGRDPEPVAVIRGGRVRKNRGWYRFDPGSAGPCMARARQLAKKERKKGVIDSRLTWPSVISNANCTLANCSFSALQQTRTKYPTTLFSPLSYSSLPSFLSSGENKNRSKLKCISAFKKI